MREIKYRIWMGDRFFYWGFIDGGFAGIPTLNKEGFTFITAQERSQEFTGLHDKRGRRYTKEILLNGKMEEPVVSIGFLLLLIVAGI